MAEKSRCQPVGTGIENNKGSIKNINQPNNNGVPALNQDAVNLSTTLLTGKPITL